MDFTEVLKSRQGTGMEIINFKNLNKGLASLLYE